MKPMTPNEERALLVAILIALVLGLVVFFIGHG